MKSSHADYSLTIRKMHSQLIRPFKKLTLAVTFLAFTLNFAQAAPLEYKNPPLDNPLKGLTPYPWLSIDQRFPHSLEMFYVPLNEVLIDQNNAGEYIFDWSYIETRITNANNRGNQAIFRLTAEYPRGENQKFNEIPTFLMDDGLEVEELVYFGGLKAFTPDYESPILRAALQGTIAELGAVYDGDNRVAFIELGLIGSFGEWHNHTQSQTAANATVRGEVLEAYANAFSETKLLVRYARGADKGDAANFDLPVGYHDDSFAFSTFGTNEWNFLHQIQTSGASNKWQSYPIGGEVYPGIRNCIFADNCFDSETGNEATDFQETVEAAHVTYMRVGDPFQDNFSAIRRQRAEASVHRMGYNLYFSEATITPSENSITVNTVLENQGVAPFYYNWPMTVALLDATGSAIQEWNVDWRIDGLLPNEQRTFSGMFSPTSPIPAGAKMALRVPNPLSLGKPVRFSNTTQELNGNAWMILGNANGSVTTSLIDRSSWNVSGTPNSNAAHFAIDGDDSTRWTTVQNQQPGQSFTISFGQEECFDRIVIDATTSANDYPRGYTIQGSNDGNTFTNITNGTGTAGITEITLNTPVSYSHLRILQTGTVNQTIWWSIGEIKVYRPTQLPSVAIQRSQWTLSRSGNQSLNNMNLAIDGNLNSRWTTNVAQSSGLDFIIDFSQQEPFNRILLESPNSSDDYPRGYIVRGSNDGSNYTDIISGSGSGATLDINLANIETYRYLQIELTASTNFNWWSIEEINVYAPSSDHCEVETVQPTEPTLKVFIIAGQSNMQGRGVMGSSTRLGTLQHTVANDPENKYQFVVDNAGQWQSYENAWFYYQRSEFETVTSEITAGLGVNNSIIGPELGFGYIIDSHFEEPVLIIKAAWGGKSLAIDFRPPSSSGDTGFYYNEILRVVNDAISNLSTHFPDYNGQGYEFAGFGWHQGWADRADRHVVTDAEAYAYSTHMANFIRDMREDLNAPDLPFVIATTGMGGDDISDGRELAVMNAQLSIPMMEEFAGNTFTVDTRSFYRPNNISPINEIFHWHGNAASYLDIGLAMGEAMTTLLPALQQLPLINISTFDSNTNSFQYQLPTQQQPPLTYTLEVSTDLINWDPLTGATKVVTQTNPNSEVITVTLPNSMSNNQNAFFRITGSE